MSTTINRNLRIMALATLALVSLSCSSGPGNTATERENSAPPSSSPGDIVAWEPTTTVTATSSVPSLQTAEQNKVLMEPLLNIMGLNPELTEVSELEPFMQNKKTMGPALQKLMNRYDKNREYEVRADNFQDLPKDICDKMRAGEGCVEISFYILLEGQPATPLIKAQVTPSENGWVMTEHGLCMIMASLGVRCGIDVGLQSGFNPAVPNES